MKNSFNTHIKLLGFNNSIIYFIQKHLLKQKDLVVKLKGYKHPVYLRNGTSDTRVFSQLFVGREYLNAIRNINPKVIIDCGANIGLASIYFKFYFPNAKIFAFEPESSNFNM